jgi:chorismate synthase
MIRYLAAGESHGKGLYAIIDGMPAGLAINIDFINASLKRRQGGFGRSRRMSLENDSVQIFSGLYKGKTNGAPLELEILNRMRTGFRAHESTGEMRVPRPGHADFAGMMKYGFTSIEPVMERASARSTAIMVACGNVAYQLIREVGITVIGYVISIGTCNSHFSRKNLDAITRARDSSQVYCPDKLASSKMVEIVKKAMETGDTLGGTVEVTACGVPSGIGSYVHPDKRLESRLGAALFSIPSVKAVEIGTGIQCARLHGSMVHDSMYPAKSGSRLPVRKTNRAGGIEGGMSNGGNIVVRAYAKPLSTLKNPLKSVDIVTMEKKNPEYMRSDTCAVPAISVIAEAVISWELASEMIIKFGGDTVDAFKKAFTTYFEDTGFGK